MSRRPPRPLAAGSAVLLAGVVGLWVRSYRVADAVPLGWARTGWECASDRGWIVLRNRPAIAAQRDLLNEHQAMLAARVDASRRQAWALNEYDEQIDAALRGEGPFPLPPGLPPVPPSPPAAPAGPPPPVRYGVHHAAFAAPLTALAAPLVRPLVRPLALMMLALMQGPRRRPRAGHCRECGYDLTANASGRCPECGTGVAPRPAAPAG